MGGGQYKKGQGGGCCCRPLPKAEIAMTKMEKGVGGYPDAEKGWKSGKPGKYNRMNSQGSVGQER